MRIEDICYKAFKLLGFVIRVICELKFSSSLLFSYTAITRIWISTLGPHIYLVMLVWSSIYKRKCLRFASYSLHIFCCPHDYTHIRRFLGLSSLADRRQAVGLRFFIRLIFGEIDTTALLDKVNFKVPACLTRTIDPFYVLFSLMHVILIDNSTILIFFKFGH